MPLWLLSMPTTTDGWFDIVLQLLLDDTKFRPDFDPAALTNLFDSLSKLIEIRKGQSWGPWHVKPIDIAIKSGCGAGMLRCKSNGITRSKFGIGNFGIQVVISGIKLCRHIHGTSSQV